MGLIHRSLRYLAIILSLAVGHALGGCAQDEICDWEDNDKDGIIDEGFDADGDGHWACGLTNDRFESKDYDCDDNDAAVSPSAQEVCDGIDNDCSGAVDDGCGEVSLAYPGLLIQASVQSLGQGGDQGVMVCGRLDGIGFELLVLADDGSGHLQPLASNELGDIPLYSAASRPETGDGRYLGVSATDMLTFSSPDDGLRLLSRETLWAESWFDLTLVDVGDLEGDGDLDMVAVGALSFEDRTVIRVVLQQGGGHFKTAHEYTLDSFFKPSLVKLVDLDGDGDLDLMTVGEEAVEWRLNDGEGRFVNGGFYLLAAKSGQGAVADFDGDGRPDLLVTLPDRWKLLLFRNQTALGGPAFGEPSSVETAVRHPVGLAAADINRDGRLDLLLSDGYESAIHSFFRQGSGALVEGCVIPTHSPPTALMTASLGGAATLDLIAAFDDEDALTVSLDICAEEM